MIFPDVRRFVVSLGRALKLLVRGEGVVAPLAVSCYREQICRRCRHFDGGQCEKCTCFVRLKVILRSEACPIGKWGRLDEEQT